MSCETSWMPAAVASTLRADTPRPLLAWLAALRATVEEYDPLILAPPPSPSPPSRASTSPDSAFDEILSQLGKEIFQLDQYQRHLTPEDNRLSLSILNIFDECLDQIGEKRREGVNEASDGDMTLSDKLVPAARECAHTDMTERTCEETESEVPIGSDNGDMRTRLISASSSSSIYEDVESSHESHEWSKLIESESDSESTCWSYREWSRTERAAAERESYSGVWSHSSGFHNSDAILRRVVALHEARQSRLSAHYDTVQPLPAARYPVYALQEVAPPVRDMPPPPSDDGGYEPVRDAPPDNIYEEIEFGTDEGCSCGTSLDLDSCSLGSEARDSPEYVNLRDHGAYALTHDVIYWKNLLQDPFYCDDEEDDWITPEECAVYSREQRPPLVIPRITPYRPPRTNHHPYPEEGGVKSFGRAEYSPVAARAHLERSFNKAGSDSPPCPRLNKKLSGSTENILGPRRPQHLQLPASSSGDSLDIEIRGEHLKTRNGRKSHSVHVGHKPGRLQRSPVPAPRTMLPPPRQLPEASLQVLHEGPVKRTKYVENGKKSKKNWTECYMILTPTALVFYKDYKTYQAFRQRSGGTPPSPNAPRLELVLPLLNARVLPARAAHTRRYSKSLWLTVDYDEYLIQDDTEKGNERWLAEIQRVIYKLYPLMMNMESSMHPQSSNTDLESLGRTPPASRHASNRSKHKAGGSSNEDLSDSTDNSIQKSHVRKRLRDFFARRPAMEVLMKKGYYKDEPVFGRNLEEVCSTTSPRVPEFVVACVNEIESSEENMCTDGLYRASGNLSQVQKIRLEIDQTSKSHVEVIKNNTDIHVLTGSLKLFFRELKEPLIPCNMFDRILTACSLKPREVKIREFRDIINSLPQCNRDTLKYLLEHLLRVTKYSERNRMHTANLAIVFGPTLLWAPAEQAHNIAVDCIQQNNVVDILLNEFHEIFVEDNAKGKKKA